VGGYNADILTVMMSSKTSLKSTALLAFLIAFITGCATQGNRFSNMQGAAFAPGEAIGVYHTLERGETLWRLGKMYGVDVKQLMATNHINNPSDLKVGLRLFIPGRKEPVRILPYLPESRRWKYIVIHHSATENGNAKIFDKSHRKRGFWNGLGYHFVIDNGTSGTRPGQIETGDRWYRQMNGAHCNAMGMNEIGIGVCLVGNFDEQSITPEQLQSAAWLVKSLQWRYGISANHVIRHCDVKGKDTDCPGNRFPWHSFQRLLA